MKPHEHPETNPELKNKCKCGPECDCGCNEGKECKCDDTCKYGYHCGNECKCGCGSKHCGGKIIILLIVFLAGMGFNELLHGCFGRCPDRGMSPMPMISAPHRPMSGYTDNAGTVVIINTGGDAEVFHGMKHYMKHGDKHHFDKMKKHHKKYQDESAKPQIPTEIDG